MARIAVILGVSNYARQQSLPACQNDADLIRFILINSKEYEDILFLAGSNTNNDEVKHQLTHFVEKHKARKDLDEVFFFYSGHGQFLNDEFYYILSDFDESRRNRTCLRNSELDGYLRTLSPNLAVKIVDACNAGVQYIKDASGLAAVIEKGSKAEGLKKVYFLFSSLIDQSSFASTTVSCYTRSFVEAIYTHGRPEIRYRDIVDQIADQFESSPDQRPFFVIQADNTENFGSFSDKDKSDIRARLEAITAISSTAKAETPTPAKQPTLADLIIEDAKDYLSEAEIIMSVEHLLTAAKCFTLPLDIGTLFEVKVDGTKDFQGLVGLEEIGKWLDENKKEYFARVVMRVKKRESVVFIPRPRDAFRSMAEAESYTPGELSKVRSTEQVIAGYEPMWDKLPFWRIALVLNTRFPNVPTFTLNLLYLFSRLDIRLFYSIDQKWPGPEDIGSQTTHGPWKALQLRLRDLKENPSAVDAVFVDFTNSVIEKLKQIVRTPEAHLAEWTDTPDALSK